MDSKCSGQEHLVKSLVGTENIPSKMGSYSYGTSPLKAHIYDRTVFSMVALGCDY